MPVRDLAAAHTLVTFDQPGILAVATGKGRVRLPAAATIVSVAATVNTAPTGASIKVDVNKNGTTVFTTQANRPDIAAAGFASADAIPDVTALAAGDYISVDIDQIGSTVTGSDLSVIVELLLATGTSPAPAAITVSIGQVTSLQAALDAKIAAALVDAKGDLIVASAADTVVRLPVGSNDQVLTADSAQSSGVKWATGGGGGGGGSGRFRSARYYLVAGDYAARSNTFQPVNGRLYAVPVWVAEAITVARLTIEVTTAASAGGLLRVGIYASTSAAVHYPGALLQDSGTLVSTSTGVKGDVDLATPIALAANDYYWFVLAEQGAPTTGATIRGLSGVAGSGANPIGFAGAANANAPMSIQTTGATGALPGTFAAGVASNTDGPAIMFKVA